jgi:hypothetical protein
MRQPILDEELILYCACSNPSERVWFVFEAPKEESALPWLSIDFETWSPGLWGRIKEAWKTIMTGRHRREADLVLYHWKDLEDIRDFCDRCLKHRGEPVK